MSYLQGVTFADQNVTPPDDARLYASACTDGILTGCAMASVGATFTMAAGSILAAGRNIRVPGTQTFAVTGAVSGYARLLLTIDLTQTATESLFQQVEAEIQYSATLDGFPSLIQDDINGSGTMYQMVLAVMTLSSAGISAIIQQLGPAHARGHAFTITLAAADWSGTTITVDVPGMTPDINLQVAYAPASRQAWLDADIWCSAQGAGTLTFTASSAPAVDVVANVILL